MRLDRQRILIEDLNADLKATMFNLMNKYYGNTDAAIFESDLKNKDWVLALYESEQNTLVGFSTQKLFKINFLEKHYQILFSGDTIVEQKYWGSMALSLAFAELVLDILKSVNGDELYWMLITKGLRTYKFLPAYFVDYYPCYNKSTPEDTKHLMDILGNIMFPDSYNAQKGIVQAKNGSQFLRSEYEPDDKMLSPKEQFYYDMNPGYKKGDELVCLTRIDIDNLHPFIKRAVNRLKDNGTY